MKAITDARMDKLESLALDDSVQIIEQFLKSKGLVKDSTLGLKVKVAIGALGAFARVRASETNRTAIELQAKHLGSKGQLVS
jgi:hypothetical protein